jgi:hypothetical protein
MSINLMRIRSGGNAAAQRPRRQGRSRGTRQCHRRARLSPCRSRVFVGSGSEAAAATAASASLEDALRWLLDRQGGGPATKYRPRCVNEDRPCCSSPLSLAPRWCLSALVSRLHTSLARRGGCGVRTARRLDHTASPRRRRLCRSTIRPATGKAAARFSRSKPPQDAHPAAPRSEARPNPGFRSTVSQHGTWE